MARISDYFTTKEMECRCGCGTCNISPELLRRADLARRAHGKPIHVNSGCRCPQHNEDEGGKPDSAHIATKVKPCEAFDIRCKSSRSRFELICALIQAGFTRIGIAKTFLHADVAEDWKDKNVIWIY